MPLVERHAHVDRPAALLLGDLQPELAALRVHQEQRGALDLEQLAEAEGEGGEHLLEHALERVVLGELGHPQELLGLLGDLVEQRGEAILGELDDAPLELALAVAPGEHVHHLARVGGDRLGEGAQPAVLEVDDAVGDVEDAVVVGDQQHRDALLLGEVVHQVHHLAAGLLVERGGGLVGQDQARAAGEGARDRHALALSARELRGILLRALAEADSVEHRLGAPARFGAGGVRVEEQRHLHVLRGGQRVEQVVRLEDVADLAAHGSRARGWPRRAARRRARARCLPAPSAARRSGSAAWSCPSPRGPVTITISPPRIATLTSWRIWRRSAPPP